MGHYFYYGGWAPYVSVAERKKQARQTIARLQKKGHICQPVTIEGRTIAKSFWGNAWCGNLESYSDYENRLPRGRSYVRNGSVVDLRIETGQVRSLVSGSEIYHVRIDVQPLAAKTWKAIIKACSGEIASLIELLQGRLSHAVMTAVTARGQGLLPSPRHIRFSCDCPDSVSMCKHIAATLYGVAVRLDNEPELLFRLRHVDPQELIGQLGQLPTQAPSAAQAALQDADLSALFGIDLGDLDARAKPSSAATTRSAKRSRPSNTAAPKTSKTAPPRPGRSKTLAASELIARGVPRHMIHNWIVAGVLRRSQQRGVYRTTAQTEPRIVAYLDRGSGGK